MTMARGDVTLPVSHGWRFRQSTTQPWQRYSWLGAILILVAVMVALTPLAYADPPDPTWLHAIYDDDDFDLVVGLIMSASGLAEVYVARCLGPVEIRMVLRGPPLDRPATFVLLSASDPRAPPAV